jgi:ABC-type Fe3+/spermidine/putrescine transport system ATPase subunit
VAASSRSVPRWTSIARRAIVAEFLGSSNLFEGKVAEIDDSSIRIKTPALHARVPVNPLRRFSVGDAIDFVVPEDRIRVLPPDSTPMENCVSARLIGEEFVGATLRLYADAGAQQEIRLLRPMIHDRAALEGLRIVLRCHGTPRMPMSCPSESQAR